MANLEIRDGDVAEKFIKATGAGSDADPFITQNSTTLLAGTAAFGKLAANSGVDIGDVDVTTCGTITPGTGATNLGKAVDTAAGSTDTGVAGLVIRDDALTTLTPVDGDYVNERVNARGATWVAIENGSGGQLTSFGGTSIADDAAFTVGTTSITPVGGTYKSTRDSVDDNDAGAFAMTAKRGLYTVIETPNGDSAMDETNDAVRVNIVAGAGSGGTAMTDDAAFTVGTTSVTPAAGIYRSTRDVVDDGDAGALAMTSRRGLYASLETPNGDSVMDDTNDCVKTSVVTALPAGTNNIGDVDVLTLPNVTLAAGTNTNEVVGDVAHDAAIAGNPLTIGGVASAAAPSDVSADQDAVRAWFLRNGAQATVVTAGGALIGGDATNGLDVDVTRLPALPAGTNNIGDVDVLTLPALPAGNNNIGDVDVASLPALAAGTNLIGRVSSSDETSTIYNGTTALTPKFAIIDAATSGDNTLLAAVASKKIRVLSLFMVSAGTVNARFESGAGGTALSGQMNLIANSGFVLPYNPVGWFETASNTLLNLELSAAISVDGSFVYVEV